VDDDFAPPHSRDDVELVLLQLMRQQRALAHVHVHVVAARCLAAAFSSVFSGLESDLHLLQVLAAQLPQRALEVRRVHLPRRPGKKGRHNRVSGEAAILHDGWEHTACPCSRRRGAIDGPAPSCLVLGEF
jgi:hypothetical protein